MFQPFLQSELLSNCPFYTFDVADDPFRYVSGGRAFFKKKNIYPDIYLDNVIVMLYLHINLINMLNMTVT